MILLTFFLMIIDPAHHIYNIQLAENVFQGNLFLSKFSSAAPILAITAMVSMILEGGGTMTPSRNKGSLNDYWSLFSDASTIASLVFYQCCHTAVCSKWKPYLAKGEDTPQFGQGADWGVNLRHLFPQNNLLTEKKKRIRPRVKKMIPNLCDTGAYNFPKTTLVF